MRQGKSKNELRKSVIVEGAKLEIITRKNDDEEWELFVENSYRIRSVWNDTFDTAQSALEAAEKAIESEGIEPFVDTEGFEYLFEEREI